MAQDKGRPSLEPGASVWHGPEGYGWVTVIEHTPATGAVRVTDPSDASRFAPLWTVRAADLYNAEQE